MNEQPLIAKPVDLPRGGITLSDCMGIVVGCAVLFGVLRMRGPLPWLKPQKTDVRQTATVALLWFIQK